MPRPSRHQRLSTWLASLGFLLGLLAPLLTHALARSGADVDAALARGEHTPLLHWLRARVHAMGSLLGFNDLLRAATGQPLDPAEWTTPPFEPVVRDGIIYARGSTDNKGQILAHILGVGETLREKGGLPVNLIFLIDLDEHCDTRAQQDERRRWFEQHGRGVPVAPHGNQRDPHRRLRVGYVSADFRAHSAAFSFRPVIEHHDHSQFEVILYSGVVVPDDIPHDYVLKIAMPYMGTWVSQAFDWTPLKHFENAFEGFNKPNLDTRDPWQFKNFLLADGK